MTIKLQNLKIMHYFLFSLGKPDQNRRNFRVACDSNRGHQDGKSGYDHCAVKPLKVSSRVHKHSCVVFWHQCLLTSVTQKGDFGLQQHRQTVSRRPGPSYFFQLKESQSISSWLNLAKMHSIPQRSGGWNSIEWNSRLQQQQIKFEHEKKYAAKQNLEIMIINESQSLSA